MGDLQNAALAFAFIIGIVTAQYQPHCAAGKNGKVIVHLFSWRWGDIATECENILGPKGFCGVQVSPPNEHRIVASPHRPWWERYQPVSWKLDSASGSRAQFIDMVQRCNAVGVRIYIDAVINHMAGVDSGTGRGTGGSYYNTQNMQFDGVPFRFTDFGRSCSTSNGNIQNYNDVNQVRNCRLLGLLDLAGGSSYVRGKLAGYFNDMLDIGIDGYRIDAAKHMWPGDIEGVLSQTRNSKFGGKPYVFQEVIDLYGSEPIKSSDYTHLGSVTEFKYGLKMGEIFKTDQVAMKNLRMFGSSWGMLPSGNAIVFVDNHDNQRGHGGGGNIITYKSSKAYKMATVFMLSWPYGVPRVMSSYDFHDDGTGPPTGSPGSRGLCQNGWICEHRWRQITNMVQWRNHAGDSAVENWWSNGNNQIAYSRGSTSFIAFNKKDGSMDEWLTTGLPSGTYCDIISGNLESGQCTGTYITVGSDSRANIKIDGHSKDPIVAFHVGSKIDGSVMPPGPGVTTLQPSVPDPPAAGERKTIVFLKKQTTTGQNLFLRGGCSGTPCTINIKYGRRIGSHFSGYNSWAAGDTKLGWSGAEPGQGTHLGVAAQGSPMAWTSSSPSSPGHVTDNSHGDHYWMWEVYMDCSQTADGYFEVKGYLNGQWEADISQSSCSGVRKPTRLSASKNHVARCGYKNVFEWNSNSCSMQQLQELPPIIG